MQGNSSISGGNYFCPGLFRAILTAKNLKAVHLHTGGLIGAMVRLAVRLCGVPYVISIHGGQADLPKEQMNQLLAPLKGTFNWGKILEILLRANRVHANADTIISLGESERRKLREQYPHTRVEVLPNGVDCRRFASADGAAFRKKYQLGNGLLILCVGSFHRQKNQMTLFEAFAWLRKTSMPDIKLVLIGVVYDEAYFREISARAANSGLADSTLLLPNLPYDSPDLANAYAAADLFALPSSLYEPFGIVVLEAWSAKCPVICARTGGLADFGHDGDNLRFTDTSDAGALAEAIAKLHFAPSLSARLAANGQKNRRNLFVESNHGKTPEFLPEGRCGGEPGGIEKLIPEGYENLIVLLCCGGITDISGEAVFRKDQFFRSADFVTEHHTQEKIQKCRIMHFPVLRCIGKFPRREIFSECGIDRRFAPDIGTRNQR